MTGILDFEGLATALADKASFAGPNRNQLLAQYKHEIVVLMAGLRRAEVVGQNLRPGQDVQSCDLCGGPLEATKLYVDGNVPDIGGWANMCLSCFLDRGEAIGWGVGQLYQLDAAGWQCVAGGAPEPVDEAA